MFFNAHTHYYIYEGQCDDTLPVVNLSPEDSIPNNHHCAYSIGLHPWNVGNDWQDHVALVLEKARDERVLAIGECGLDKVHEAEHLDKVHGAEHLDKVHGAERFDQQRQAFAAQLQIAQSLDKPVIVHCVKAHDELLAMIRPDMRIMLHGFRGKWQQAKQMAAKGIVLSFGSQYNIDALRYVYSSNLPFLLETDDLHLSVHQIYDQVAHHLGVDVDRLVHLCEDHQKAFYRHSF